jgi:hypothetical protein
MEILFTLCLIMLSLYYIAALLVIALYYISKESKSDAAVCKNCKEKSITGIVNCTQCKEFNY